jgi:hypothetical protein
MPWKNHRRRRLLSRGDFSFLLLARSLSTRKRNFFFEKLFFDLRFI